MKIPKLCLHIITLTMMALSAKDSVPNEIIVVAMIPGAGRLGAAMTVSSSFGMLTTDSNLACQKIKYKLYDSRYAQKHHTKEEENVTNIYPRMIPYILSFWNESMEARTLQLPKQV